MAVKIYDVYGTKQGDIDNLSTALQVLIGGDFRPHYSSYKGDYYQHSSGNYELCPNYVDEDGDWRISDFRKYSLLLYVNNVPQPNKLLYRFSKSELDIKLLTRSEYWKDGMTLFFQYRSVRSSRR